jgi:Cu(I)/Ag(I) efflux system periplasmic protein CusF
MKRVLLLCALACALPALAQAPMDDGEVRRVNKRTKEITIKHPPIPRLAMPAMTMPFPVKEEAMLDRVQEGDKVKFFAEKIGDEAVIIRIEVVK